MKDLKKKALAVVGAVALAGTLVGASVAVNPPAPEPIAVDEYVKVPASLGVNHCIAETWHIPERYKTINSYLHDYPDAKPSERSTFWCGALGLPADIPANETFQSYNYPTDPTVEINL